MSDTERVTMIWPKELKDQVREKAGKRGITEFVLEAATIHLGVAPDLQGIEKELNEVRYLTQQLADLAVMGGSGEDRIARLMEIELPSWIDTSGWPSVAAERVRPEVITEPEPFETPDPDRVAVFNEAVELSEEVVEEPEIEEQVQTPVEVSAPAEDLPHDQGPPIRRSGDDLLAKIQAKAAEKGVDLSGAALRPASTVAPPEAKPASEPEPEPTVEDSGLYVDDDDQAQESLEAGKCPSCGEELVDGECWTCG